MVLLLWKGDCFDVAYMMCCRRGSVLVCWKSKMCKYRITYFLNYLINNICLIEIFNLCCLLCLDVVSLKPSTASIFVPPPELDELKSFQKLVSRNWILNKSFSCNSHNIQILVHVCLFCWNGTMLFMKLSFCLYFVFCPWELGNVSKWLYYYGRAFVSAWSIRCVTESAMCS